MSGKLEKLWIEAYSDPEFKNKLPDGKFTTLINPEKYSLLFKTEYTSTPVQGNEAPDLKFSHTAPKDLDLEFLFDSTGIFPSSKNTPEIPVPAGTDKGDTGVDKDIEFFQKVVYSYNGDIHKPNYLLITWGSLIFKGVLSEMNIEYKLFNSDGKPLRALAKVKFRSFIDEDLRIAKQNNHSPDLTHVRVVRQGDTLPLLTYQIYGDSKYYLEVAKYNKLPSFRKLTVGQSIKFPPIEKPGITNG